MGRSPTQPSRTSEVSTTQWGEDWHHVQREDINPTSQEAPSTTSVTSNLVPMNGGAQDTQSGFHLPLESLVLDDRDNEIPHNFLNLYPTILRKFPGAPCEALAKTITYLQALFTLSPGFHPYVTHLPFNSLPKNESSGRHVAEMLERYLIHIVQHLFAFFNSDVQVVRSYIESCPAELIPPPVFVISPNSSPSSAPRRLINGVQGFNNNVRGGENTWQNPICQLTRQYTSERDTAVQKNINKCFLMINRKLAVASSEHPPLFPLQPLPPLRSQPHINDQPSPAFSTLPSPRPTRVPQIPGLQGPSAPASLSRPPHIFHFPAPNQMHLAAVQPNPGLPHSPARFPASSMQPTENTLLRMSASPNDSSQSASKDDIHRLEAKVAEVFEMLSRKNH